MTLREEIRSLKQGRRELRSFGLLVGGLLLALGGLAAWRQSPSAARWLLGFGAPLFVLGALFPPALKWPHRIWMTFAFVMGRIVSTLLLVVLYFGLVTPIGVAARLFGRDFLQRRRDPDAASYWQPRGNARSRYEDQF